MSEERRDPHDSSTYGSDAGLPVSHAGQQPTDTELDERNRSMAGPRRAAGPPLGDDAPGAALTGAPPHEPPPTTDPMSEAMPRPQDASAQVGDAGLPIGHAGPKPSDDELDRRNRMMGGPRRAAGPPLHDDAPEAAIREAALHEPPPATDPLGS
jgi:hypothetical protein